MYNYYYNYMCMHVVCLSLYIFMQNVPVLYNYNFMIECIPILTYNEKYVYNYMYHVKYFTHTT